MFNLGDDEVLSLLGYKLPEEDYIQTARPAELKEWLSNYDIHSKLINFFLETPGIYLCGGAVRAFAQKEEPNDFDFYFSSAELAEQFNELAHSLGYYELNKTERAITLVDGPTEEGNKIIQVITFVGGEVESCLAEFDFTIVKSAFTGGAEGVWIKHINFADALEFEVLRYCGSRAPLSSLQRVTKYIDRGFHISMRDLIAIVKDINSKVDLDNFDQVQEAMKSFDPLDVNGGENATEFFDKLPWEEEF